MTDLCENCGQDEVYAECGWCQDGRGLCGTCFSDHECMGKIDIDIESPEEFARLLHEW